jgi:hypothetical protein
MLEIVLGPLWVWLVIGERPGTASLVGGIIIFAAVLAPAVVRLGAARRAVSA